MDAIDPPIATPRPAPALHDLVAYVKEHGASAAARHFNIGYSIVRRKVRSAGLHLHRGRRRDKGLAARNADIRVLRMEGKYLIDIGRLFNLGRERVRQILEETGGDPLKMSSREPEVPPALPETPLP
jgi:hypothetical protein